MKPVSLIVSGMLLAIVGCTATRRPALPTPTAAESARIERLVAQRAPGVGTNYRVAPGDKLAIEVPGADELTGEFAIARDGTVELPLIGAQSVAGKTESAIADELRLELAEKYLQAPEVRLRVVSRTRRASVVGAVAKPGFYELAGSRETILDLVTRAGGIAGDASPTIYFTPAGEAVPRKKGKVPAGLFKDSVTESADAIEIDLTDLYQGRMVRLLELPVRDGDTILVKKGGQIFLDGWVENPKTYDLIRAMTLTQVITKGGGLSFAASSGDVTLTRQERDGKLQVYRVDYPGMIAGKEPDIFLQPGDRVEVGANALKVVPWAMYKVVSSIVRIGIGGGVALF